MQRIVSVLAFTLGFTGVIALATGWSSPAVSQTDGRTNDTPGANWLAGRSAPASPAPVEDPEVAVAPGTAAQSRAAP